MLRLYGRGRNELIMMMRDINQLENNERLMLEMDSEHRTALRDLLRLQLDEQKAHDLELSQFHDDVLQHITSATDEIVADVDRSEDTDSFGGSSVNEINCDFYREPPESSDDDFNDNTDTDDGHDEATDLLQSKMQLVKFLDRQRTTIVRLRARIFRLNDIITDLNTKLSSIRGHDGDNTSHDISTNSACWLPIPGPTMVGP
jgi:hypothetical protein